MKRTVLIVVVLIIIGLVAWLCIDALSTPKEEKAAKYLENDKAHLEQVAEHLSNSGLTDFCLIDDSGYDSATNRKIVRDTAVLNEVEYLFDKHGYKEIRKEGATVRFVRWTYIGGFEAGICYAPDSRPQIEFLTATKPLSVKGWYYYEADYNEWRTNN